MAIKKSELYSSLWKSCDELRGGMDASQYKDYVLVLLFIKYVSDKYAGQSRPLIEIPEEGINFQNVVTDMERELILQSLRRTNGNKKLAAKLLNLKRTTLIEKIKRIGLRETATA